MTSLKYGPLDVGYFDCGNNNLSNLDNQFNGGSVGKIKKSSIIRFDNAYN